jgi:hypothetical protein
VGAARTDSDAGSAGDAARGEEPDFRIGMLPFGVVAPETVQWASLEENCRSYARPVVEGEPLNVKHHASGGHTNRWRIKAAKKGVRDPARGNVRRLVKELVKAR